MSTLLEKIEPCVLTGSSLSCSCCNPGAESPPLRLRLSWRCHWRRPDVTSKRCRRRACPSYVQSGRGGGWQLIGDARTNLSGLSVYESRAVFWLLGTAGLASPQTRLATKKLIRALPESMRDEAERLAASIHYDHTAWGEHPRESAKGLELLRDAIVKRQMVRASYTTGRGRPGRARASAPGAGCQGGHLVSHCGW